VLVDDWVRALIIRHTAELSRPEFLKAVRALSARYVESRAQLSSRSPIDSAGKRAAFAGFFAPLHFLVVRSIVREVAHDIRPRRLVDLGCGTGVAAAAWASGLTPSPAISAIDLNSWALDEARWNCRQLALDCRTRKLSLVDALAREIAAPSSLAGSGIVCAWSVNELTAPDRTRTLELLIDAHNRGAHVLVVEPLALSAVPWWESWSQALVAFGGRSDEWRFVPNLPQELAQLDEAAGFRRDHLTARAIWLEGLGPAGPANDRPIRPFTT
jgi:hypothetical protein